MDFDRTVAMLRELDDVMLEPFNDDTIHHMVRMAVDYSDVLGAESAPKH